MRWVSRKRYIRGGSEGCGGAVELLRHPLNRVILHVIDIVKKNLFLYLWPLALILDDRKRSADYGLPAQRTFHLGTIVRIRPRYSLILSYRSAHIRLSHPASRKGHRRKTITSQLTSTPPHSHNKRPTNDQRRRTLLAQRRTNN